MLTCPCPKVVSSSKEKPGPTYKYDPVSKRMVLISCCQVSDIEYTVINGTNGVDPGAGNCTLKLSGTVDPGTGLSIYILQFSTTYKNSRSASNFLSNMASSITITISKDSNNFYKFTRLSSTNNTSYWSFNAVVDSFSGGINFGDGIKLTYT